MQVIRFESDTVNSDIVPNIMDTPLGKSWIRVAILVGVVYFVVGVAFAELAKSVVSDHVRFNWRLAAWIASGAVFAIHIGYEHFRLRSSPRTTALHAAMAVALGAFLLAIAALAHTLVVPTHAPYWLYFLALVLWPLFTALPAFLAALTVAFLLVRLSTKRLAE